ncbi:hypothetical protein HZA99_04160 [Candidatus Woesearchaeota archaeon]|nr:hypothetical protein [Candidatus Woesearchaeota archaeon]
MDEVKGHAVAVLRKKRDAGFLKIYDYNGGIYMLEEGEALHAVGLLALEKRL